MHVGETKICKWATPLQGQKTENSDFILILQKVKLLDALWLFGFFFDQNWSDIEWEQYFNQIIEKGKEPLVQPCGTD